MKLTIGVIVFIAIVAIFGFRAMAGPGRNKSVPSADQMYRELRDLALHTKAVDIGLHPQSPRQPFAIVMDMDIDGKTATITSFSSGDASLYLSSGGGTIGSGQASEDVAKAAKNFVAAAVPHLDAMSKSASQPLPGSGEVIFYVVTKDGIYSATRSEQVLGEQQDSLSPLFYAGQEVLTQIRLLQDRQQHK